MWDSASELGDWPAERVSPLYAAGELEGGPGSRPASAGRPMDQGRRTVEGRSRLATRRYVVLRIGGPADLWGARCPEVPLCPAHEDARPRRALVRRRARTWDVALLEGGGGAGGDLSVGDKPSADGRGRPLGRSATFP